MKFLLFFSIMLFSISSVWSQSSNSELRTLNLINSSETESISYNLSLEHFYLSKIILSHTQSFDGSTTYDMFYVSNESFLACIVTIKVGNVDNNTDIVIISNTCQNN